MTKPLVSIIIPVFNAESYLQQTLDSLCRQDYQNIEILCIDDGSTDASSSIVNSYKEKDSRIIYIHQDNSGPGAARNHGIELARGEFIVFQDADDLLHPKTISRMGDVAERYQADVAICGFQSCSDSLSDVDWNIDLTAEPEVVMGDLALAFQNSQKFRGHPWGKLYRRDTIGDIRFNNLRSGEDTCFNIDIAARSKCFVVLSTPFYIYRQVNASITHQASHHANTIEAAKAIGLHCIELERQGIISDKAMLALIRRYATNAICLHLLLMMDNESLSDEQRKSLLNLSNDILQSLKSKMPFYANIYSWKYYWMYLTAVRLHSLAMLRLICKLRNLIL